MRTNAWKALLGSLAIGAMAASGSGCATAVGNDGGGGVGGDEPTSTTTTSTTTTSTTSTSGTTTSSGSGGAGGGEGGAGGGFTGGDSCADPIEIVDDLRLTGTDFTQFANDYQFLDSSCASYNFAYDRPDLVFVREMQPGDTVQVTEHGTLDVIMHAVSGTCGAGACAESVSDQTAAQQQTTGLVYTATQAETVYFVVESFYGPVDQSPVDISTQTFDIRFDLVTCGDGAVVSSIEGCDDGNDTDGDGCSATCTVETGYLCTGAPSVCTESPSCANPVTVTGDFSFTGSNLSQFPNSHTFGGSGCQGGTTARPDVTFEVQLEAGDVLTVTEHGLLDALIHLQTGTCGATTACTSSTDSDTTGVTYTATTAQSVYVFLEPYGATSTSAYDLRFNYIRCGDGVREGTETCDDGDNDNGDGCSASCTIEPGYICSQTNPSVCALAPAADCGGADRGDRWLQLHGHQHRDLRPHLLLLRCGLREPHGYAPAPRARLLGRPCRRTAPHRHRARHARHHAPPADGQLRRHHLPGFDRHRPHRRQLHRLRH
jgi:cysteine-rich repeat protein